MIDTTGVHLSYPRFEIFIDSAFYLQHTPRINEFIDLFAARFETLESLTGWSSEKFYGKKLQMYLGPTPACAGGSASGGQATVRLYEGFTFRTADSSTCAVGYVENGVWLPPTASPGELGPWWNYMRTMIHEALHAINPPTVLLRSWLTEGWSAYYEVNLLAMHGDINQETVDSFLLASPSCRDWTSYVANDYRDCLGAEIQQSMGYRITAWMLSMMRDQHGLDWLVFYDRLEGNNETLEQAYARLPISVYDADMFVIDVLGRSSGLSFPETQAIWRYDGPAGPGWGVRQWSNLSWYGDLTSQLLASCDSSGDSILFSATVTNNGDVELRDASVRFYADEVLIAEDTVTVAPHMTESTSGGALPLLVPTTYLRVVIDEGDLKVESNELNNRDSVNLSLDLDFDGVAELCDNCPTTPNSGQDDSDLDGNGDLCDNCPSVSNPSQDSVCACYADPECDGVRSNILDVVRTIEVAFRSVGATFDPPCPRERTDVNASGATDVIDVVKVIEVAFRAASPSVAFVNPCQL